MHSRSAIYPGRWPINQELTWEQASTLYDRSYQLVILMADGTPLAKLAWGTVSQ